MNLVLANWAQTQPPGRSKSAGEGRGAHQGEQGRHQPRGQAQDRQQGQPHRDHGVVQPLIGWNYAQSPLIGWAKDPISDRELLQVNTKFLESLAEKSKQHEQLEAELGCETESLNILSSTPNSAQGNINPPGIARPASYTHLWSLETVKCSHLNFVSLVYNRIFTRYSKSLNGTGSSSLLSFWSNWSNPISRTLCTVFC